MTMRSRFSEWSVRDRLSAREQILFFALALAALFSREPSLFTHPQFYAEDGVRWYAQAYNFGWLHSLAFPSLGYLQTLQRLAAGLALLVPLLWAPLTMALFGLLLQALPVPILLSRRCRNWGPLSFRIAFAAVYIAMPNVREIHVVCTNSQWHLAVVLGLLSFALPPEGIPGKIFDVALFSVGAVSGPFAILLLPLVGIFWFRRRERWTAVIFAILTCGTIVQAFVILRHYADRNHGYNGATPAVFIRLLGGNAFIGALLGSHTFGLLLPFACSACMFAIGIGLCIYCARYAGLETALFLVYCFTVFVACIRTPGIATPDPRGLWFELLEIPSQRYSFFPGLAFLFAVLWCAGFARARVNRYIGLGFALLLCVGIWKDWKIPPMYDMGFRQNAAAFEAAPPGTHVIIPIYPGGDWKMDLVKRPGR